MSDHQNEVSPIKKQANIFDNITNVELDFSMAQPSQYSFAQKIAKSSKSSIVLTCFNTFRAFVAIGILSLPFSVMLVGPILGFLGLIFVGLIVYISTQALLEIANESKFKGSNYEVLGKLLWGKPGQQLIVVLLYICSIATFMGGTLFSIDFLDFAFCSHNVQSLCHSKVKFLFLALILSLVISLIESLKPFGYISIASTFIIILAIFSINAYSLYFLFSTDLDLTIRLGKFDIKNFLTFLGVSFYTAEGIGLVLPVRASFKNNKGFGKVFYGTFIFIMWCYISLGVLSYLVNQQEIF